MNKRVLLTIFVAVLVLAAIFGYKFYLNGKMAAAMAAMTPQAVTVSVTTAKAETWPHTLVAVGSLASYQGITVKTEMDGQVRKVLCVSGAQVAEGDLLVLVDTSIEEAELRGLEAQAKLAEISLARAKELRISGTNTVNDLDVAEATASQAAASVAQLKATIAKKRIVAPFSGRMGIVKVYEGQVLSKGDAIVVLEKVDPIYVDFSVSQQELARMAVGLPVSVTLDTYPGRAFAGKIAAISPRVNDATRSVDLRAVLENKDEALRPGMYGRVEIVFPSTENALVLPSAAVVHNPYGDTVYVVDEKSVAHQRFVKAGLERGDLVMIVEGLKVGEKVVTSGQIKLRNGSLVRIDNTLAPDANPAPKPQES